MAASSSSLPQLSALSMQDNDVLWTEYLELASSADVRLVKDWTKVIDVLLVFVALFSGILTAFIIQTADNFQPQPAKVTNKILIAIYNRTMNASMPIDLEQFLMLDDSSRTAVVYQRGLLYTSLTISILVAALAMAAKLWVVRYSREVATSGPPRARAKRRQEVYDGLLAWRLEYCIDAMPILSLISVILFALFIQSSTTMRQEPFALFVGIVFEIGIAFIILASSSAAFIFDSPYRSPFSDFINIIFRIFRYVDKPIPKSQVRTRTIGILLASVGGLVASGYFVQKRDRIYLPCLYFAFICVFALSERGEEKDMRPRIFNLPLLVLVSSIDIFTFFYVSTSLIKYRTSWIILFVVAFLLLCLHAYIYIKMSSTRPKTVEAEVVSWLLKTSSNVAPAWFQKAANIAGQSHNARALLVERLLPLLSPLITSQPNVTPEQKVYINTLATLMDYEPKPRALFSNEAALERPTLPEDLINRLVALKVCSAREGNNQDGGTGCQNPEACVCEAVGHILSNLERNGTTIVESTSTEMGLIFH